MFRDDEVAVVVHGNLTDFADFGHSGIVEPGAIAVVSGKVTVKKKVDIATGVHVPHLAAAVRGQEAGAGGQEPDGAHFPKTGSSRRVAITSAATIAITGEDRARAIRSKAIGVVRLAIGDIQPPGGIDRQVAQLGKTARK